MPDLIRSMTKNQNSPADTDDMHAIEDRLRFMEMSPQSCAALRSLKTVLDRELPVALEKFYAQVRKTPETRTFFSSEEHMSRARNAQIGHWVNLVSLAKYTDTRRRRR
jgi:methyl-accepting chemotaxis protein